MRIRQNDSHGPDRGGTLDVFLARSGVLSARINRATGVIHLHSAIRPQDEPTWWSDIEFWGDLIVFLGTGLGYHIAPYVKAIPPGAKILLVDYYPRCADHCLNKVFNGLPNAVAAVTQADAGWQTLAADVCRGARAIQIVKHPASYSANRAFYDSMLDALLTRRARRNEPGNALLFYGNFFLEEELRRALAAGGKESVSLFKYNEYGTQGGARYESTLYKLIQKERPSYILSVNMKGFDSSGIVCDTAFRLGIPVVTWFVDDPHAIMLQQRPFVRNHMVALTWERAYLPWLSNQGFGGSHYLPLAADPSLCGCGAKKGNLAEVGFVGSSMGRSFLDTITSQFLWRKELEPVVAVAAEALLARRNSPVHELLREACRKTGVAIPFTDDKNLTWLCSYIIHTASMMLRKELVTACIPQGIRTFGDPLGWKAMCGDALPTWPNVDYRSEIAGIYRGIDINVNITSCQMPTAVNQRVFDVPLCGGFVLSDCQPDIEELFSPGEIAAYRSTEELVSKISHYRAHEDERRAITQKARAGILARHTYAHRIDAIRKILP